jgi:small subunit ribosomal protein S20
LPKIRSAKKRLRQARARTNQNRAYRSQLRTAVKRVRQATDAASRSAAFAEAEKLLDRAGRKRLVHPNAAARLKSRLKKIA